ncbi:MAG: hypothetical protein Q7R93_03090 [bacterium]|nr:hypothetical protein [bacterium]
MKKQDFLKTLIQELQEKADVEILRSGLFKTGEKVIITTRRKRPKETNIRRRARNTDLTEEDWARIAASLHFSRHLPALEFLKKQGNRPINLDHFPEFDWLRVNTILNKAGLPYRIILANRVTPCDDPAARVMAK